MSLELSIHLRFFASVREQVGMSEETVALPPHIKTVGQVREWLIERGGVWANAFAKDRALCMAFQHALCQEDQEILHNQEVAFFPPVTGG